ncbi:MAG: AAA family ATPase [Lachnospiraceae bacterium]|nr:AAA family ATPase [Lachnospiraceae bacterium]
MVTRKIEEKINRWIDKGSSAFLISGARQVGKTYTIRKCLEQRKCNFLEINLVETPELIPVLSRCNSVEELVMNLSLVKQYTFVPGETILFIDEAQQCKEIVTNIKFWVDEGSYKYILSGSLLGVELRNLRSAPVGYLEEVQMYPLDFEEFLWASDIKEKSIEDVKGFLNRKEPLPDAMHDTMMQLFRRYLVVGGMPAAVAEYADSRNLNVVTEIQSAIMNQYKLDFTKYEEENKKLLLQSIYDLIPSQLLKQNRRFNLADIKKGLRFERTEDSFLWLESAGVALSAYNATEPRIALEQNKKSSLVKLYLSDVGLLTTTYGNAIQLNVLNELPGSNYGGIYENAVAQELVAHGYKLYYYNSTKQGELDFVIEHKGKILPIEVKSGKDYKVHSAISNVVKNQEYQIEEAIVFSNYNISTEGKITYLPVYMCGFIRDDVSLPVLDKIEL